MFVNAPTKQSFIKSFLIDGTYSKFSAFATKAYVLPTLIAHTYYGNSAYVDLNVRTYISLIITLLLSIDYIIVFYFIP